MVMEFGPFFGQHLAIREMSIAPGAEWAPRVPGWTFLHITSGAGYWMQPGKNLEVSNGTTLIFSHSIQGAIRASQLGRTVLRFFQVEPERLAGVVTLGEKAFLQATAKRDGMNFRLLPQNHPVSEKFAEICRRRNGSNLRLRLRLLELFIQCFDDGLGNQESEAAADLDAKARLEAFLKQMAASAMLDLSFSELLKEVRCTPRHLSRIFQEAVGVSFREKQAEARLDRARELLETTNSKMYEVAVESRYQSLSLFNHMFRKRFGVTPAKWRKQLNRRSVHRQATHATRSRRDGVDTIRTSSNTKSHVRHI